MKLIPILLLAAFGLSACQTTTSNFSYSTTPKYTKKQRTNIGNVGAALVDLGSGRYVGTSKPKGSSALVCHAQGGRLGYNYRGVYGCWRR